MFLATCNKAKQLLVMRYFEHVTAKQLKDNRDNLKALVTELAPGFNTLADFSQLESMSLDCAEEVGFGMELLDQHQVALVVRVIPDPRKDIGMNILTLFHYKRRPQIVTCANLVEAAKVLAL